MGAASFVPSFKDPDRPTWPVEEAMAPGNV